MEKQVRVGVAAIIQNKNGEVLIGLRKSSHAHGTWGFPGGHLEFQEEPEICIKREVFEETGLVVTKVSKADYTSDQYSKEDKHYITLFYYAEVTDLQPKVMEPDKCEVWEWKAWDDLPENSMPPILNLKKQGFVLQNHEE